MLGFRLYSGLNLGLLWLGVLGLGRGRRVGFCCWLLRALGVMGELFVVVHCVVGLSDMIGLYLFVCT